MNYALKFLFFFCFAFLTGEVFSQNNVGIGTTAPASDAVLELKSSNQGMLVPRLSTTQRLAITSPSNGLLVYDTNYNCFYYYNAPGAIWNAMCAGPTSPTQKANVQVYYSNGDTTYISSYTPRTVKGLSITVILVDTATVILSSSGNILDQPPSINNGIITSIQLYQNGMPLSNTLQSCGWKSSTYTSAYKTELNWNVSTVIPALPPGTYLFELKAGLGSGDNYIAACNTSGLNQGIITAEVIY